MTSTTLTNDPTEPTHMFPSLEGLPRKRAAHIGRWLAAITCFVALAFIARAFAVGHIDWMVVGMFLTAPPILQGLVNTIVLTVAAMALGIALGLLAALMRLSRNPVASATAAGYIWFFRGTPVYLQLLLWFNLALVFPTLGLPGLWEARTVTVMTPFLAALLGLGICQGAYTAEVIRGGILSIDGGQYEAGHAVGMTRGQVMRHIVLPQTLRVITPPVGNEVISMLKATSLAALVSFGELIYSASLIYFVNNRVIELLIVCAVYYLVAVTILTLLQRQLEKWLGRSVDRSRSTDKPEAVL